MMIILLHIWPEQTYRFSTRKLLPSKKNRFSKESKPVFPYELLKTKSSNIPKMKEINVIGRGSSFDLNNLKEINGPIFLLSFYNPLKIDNVGNVSYKHYYNDVIGDKEHKNSDDREKYLYDKINIAFTQGKDYKKKDMVYVQGVPKVVEKFKKNTDKTISIVLYTKDAKGNDLPLRSGESFELDHLIDNEQSKLISLVEKIYLPPLLEPHPNWVPSGSFLPALCALSYFAEKINVYGWDYRLRSSPEKMSYWKLLINMYKWEFDTGLWNAFFESSLVNYYYGYQLSKLPNINIHGYMGKLSKYEKLIKKIERVLFN